MFNTVKTALTIAAIAFAATAGTAQAQNQTQSTPKGWNYEIRDGKRVPKADRQTNADGSWREVSKQGNCETVKERTANGEYKETRQCNPN